MPKVFGTCTTNQPFQNFRPQDPCSSSKPKNANNAITVFSNLHCSYLNFIQRAVLSGHLRVSTDQFKRLAALSNTTWVEQLRETYQRYAPYLTQDPTTIKQEISTLQQLEKPSTSQQQQLVFLYQTLLMHTLGKQHCAALHKKVQTHFIHFNEVINSIEVIDTQKSILLLGDSDIGAGTGWEMMLLQSTLMKKGVKITSLLSDDGFKCLRANFFIQHWQHDHVSALKATQSPSLMNLATLIEHKLVSQELVASVLQSQINSLSLLAYIHQSDTHDLAIFSHAEINNTTVKKLADEYNVSFAYDTPDEAMTTLSAIDKAFKLAVEQNTPEKHHQVFLSCNMLRRLPNEDITLSFTCRHYHTNTPNPTNWGEPTLNYTHYRMDAKHSGIHFMLLAPDTLLLHFSGKSNTDQQNNPLPVRYFSSVIPLSITLDYDLILAIRQQYGNNIPVGQLSQLTPTEHVLTAIHRYLPPSAVVTYNSNARTISIREFHDIPAFSLKCNTQTLFHNKGVDRNINLPIDITYSNSISKS